MSKLFAYLREFELENRQRRERGKAESEGTRRVWRIPCPFID